MTHTDIVKKLIGSIQPAGDASIDPERFKNLKAMCELADNLITAIDMVAYDNRNSTEYSVKQMAEYANDFLTNQIGIER